jgi:CopG family nickel-responsive transcriptional regulator
MIKRFSISLDEKLLTKFDNYINRRQYVNRSEAIRDMIRKSFVRSEWENVNKEVMGVISLVYDHHQPQLQERITEIQHHYHHQIISTTHIHMDHDNCLEVIIIRGKSPEVQQLAEKLNAIRGVKDTHLAMSSTGKALD